MRIHTPALSRDVALVALCAAIGALCVFGGAGKLGAQTADLHKQARALAAQKRVIEADAMYRRALEAGPKDGWLNADYGQFLLYQKREDVRAVEYYDRALTLKYERAWIHRQRGQALSHLKRYAESEEALKEAIASAQKDAAKPANKAAAQKDLVQAAGILAGVYVQQDRYKDAVELLHSIVQQIPDTKDASLARNGFHAATAMGHIEFGDKNYDQAMHYFSLAEAFADRSAKTDDRADAIALEVEKTLVAKRKALGELKPVGTYRLVVIFIPTIDVDFTSLSGEKVKAKRELRPQQRTRTQWIARSFARHWEAMTGGRIEMEVDFVEASDAVLRDFSLRYSTSERIAKTEVRQPDIEKLPGPIVKIVAERYPETDTFMLIWNGEGISTTANGGGRDFPIGDGKQIRRGFVHIPAERLGIPGGPVLFLHEMQHNVESMVGETLAVDGNLQTRKRAFPMCDGTAEIRYFACLFSKIVPLKLADAKRFKQKQGMQNLNFRLRNPDPRPVKQKARSQVEEIGSGAR